MKDEKPKPTNEVKITRWRVGPSRPHPGKIVGNKLVLSGGGESLRMGMKNELYKH